MPAVATSPAPLRIAPSIQGEVIARRTLGHSKRKIARDLGIHQGTVTNVLRRTGQDVAKHEVLNTLTDLAYGVVKEGLTDVSARALDRAHLGLGVLKLRDVAEQPHRPPDTRVNIAVGLLQPAAQPTEAATKAGGAQIHVSPTPNFSCFSLADLEAEVARRRANLIEAEVQHVGPGNLLEDTGSAVRGSDGVLPPVTGGDGDQS